MEVNKLIRNNCADVSLNKRGSFVIAKIKEQVNDAGFIFKLKT